jgi:sugar lactone lactonase YvrE
LRRLTQAGTLFGSNGIRIGPDGRLFVGEVLAGSVAAVDLETGMVERPVPVGATNLPDDLVFGDDGTMYITDVKPGRIWAHTPDGELRCLVDNVPSANGITAYRGRIFMDECRSGGRLMEIFPDGGEPRVLAENLELPNALEVGPDEHLYLPLVFPGEVWRFPLDGGPGERFLDGLAYPVAVKFDAAGRLTVLEGRTGAVVQTEIPTARPRIVGRAFVGSDNFVFHNGRVLVSSWVSGSITALDLDRGESEVLVAPGFVRPLGLSVAPNGMVCAADGGSIAMVSHDGEIKRLSTNADRHIGAPGYSRGICCAPDGLIYVTTVWPTGSAGAHNVYSFDPQSCQWQPIEAETVGPTGIAYAGEGTLVVADGDAGCVRKIGPDGRQSTIACDVERPLGIAVSGGSYYVTDVARGAVVEAGVRSRVLLDGLDRPEGIALWGDELFVLDAGARKLFAISCSDARATVIAENLPTGTPPGSLSPTLGNTGMSTLSPFSGVAVDERGTVYVAADGEGCILELRRDVASA